MIFPIPTCRDAVMLQHSYEIFSRHVELSVHDNMLLVHHLDSSTVLLLDVRARSNGPIAAPLPLTVAADDKVRCATATCHHQHYSLIGRAAEPA
jgi:hypothetical protein